MRGAVAVRIHAYCWGMGALQMANKGRKLARALTGRVAPVQVVPTKGTSRPIVEQVGPRRCLCVTLWRVETVRLVSLVRVYDGSRFAPQPDCPASTATRRLVTCNLLGGLHLRG